MRATLSVFCLLAVGISGLGFGLKPEFRENAPGIFSIQTAAARQPEYAGQPQGGFYFSSLKSQPEAIIPGDQLDRSMRQLTADEQSNCRAVERIRYIF